MQNKDGLPPPNLASYLWNTSLIAKNHCFYSSIPNITEHTANEIMNDMYMSN